jgi:hypothetical protein
MAEVFYSGLTTDVNRYLRLLRCFVLKIRALPVAVRRRLGRIVPMLETRVREICNLVEPG